MNKQKIGEPIKAPLNMKYTAEVTFQSFYYDEPYAPATFEVVADSLEELDRKILELREEMVYYSKASQRQYINTEYKFNV